LLINTLDPKPPFGPKATPRGKSSAHTHIALGRKIVSDFTSLLTGFLLSAVVRPPHKRRTKKKRIKPRVPNTPANSRHQEVLSAPPGGMKQATKTSKEEQVRCDIRNWVEAVEGVSIRNERWL